MVSTPIETALLRDTTLTGAVMGAKPKERLAAQTRAIGKAAARSTGGRPDISQSSQE